MIKEDDESSPMINCFSSLSPNFHHCFQEKLNSTSYPRLLPRAYQSSALMIGPFSRYCQPERRFGRRLHGRERRLGESVVIRHSRNFLSLCYLPPKLLGVACFHLL